MYVYGIGSVRVRSCRIDCRLRISLLRVMQCTCTPTILYSHIDIMYMFPVLQKLSLNRVTVREGAAEATTAGAACK